jgi:hypothetical protein
LGAEVVVVSGVGELGASGRGDQGQVRRVGYDFYLHFGPFRPMIFYLTSTTQCIYIFEILNIIQDIKDIIHT